MKNYFKRMMYNGVLENSMYDINTISNNTLTNADIVKHSVESLNLEVGNYNKPNIKPYIIDFDSLNNEDTYK